MNQTFWIGLEGMEMVQRFRSRKFSDENRVSLFQIPKIVKIAIGKNGKTDILGACVLSGLLFATRGSKFSDLASKMAIGKLL